MQPYTTGRIKSFQANGDLKSEIENAQSHAMWASPIFRVVYTSS